MLAFVAGAAAQDYPNRPITFIIPFPPGGSTTIVVRSISDKLGEALGQQIVIDNRSGAGGTVGTRALARSEPDGYTIGLGYSGTLAIGPNLYPNVGYDIRKDFAPIGRIGTAPNTLVVHPSFNVKSVPELITYAKANPAKVNFGSAGVGTVSHVCGEYFATATEIKLTHIPYKGAGPALTDLIAGQIHFGFNNLLSGLPHVRTGRLRPLGVTSAARSNTLPDLPTVDEAGLPGLYISVWHGLWAPKGTPKDVAAKLTAAIVESLADPHVRERFAALGQEIPPPAQQTPQSLRAHHAAEIKLWWPLIKAAGIKIE